MKDEATKFNEKVLKNAEIKDKLSTAGAEYVVALTQLPENTHALLAYALIETYAQRVGKTAHEVMEELDTVHSFFAIKDQQTM